MGIVAQQEGKGSQLCYQPLIAMLGIRNNPSDKIKIRNIMTIELNTLKDAFKNINELDNHFLLHHSDLREELITTVLPVAVEDYLTYLSENPDHDPADPYTALAGQDYLSLFSDEAMTAAMADRDAHEYHRFDTSQLATIPDRELVRDDVEKACAAAIEIEFDEHFR